MVGPYTHTGYNAGMAGYEKQVSAVKAALDSVAPLLLQDHTSHCVVEAIQAGDGGDKIRELKQR